MKTLKLTVFIAITVTFGVLNANPEYSRPEVGPVTVSASVSEQRRCCTPCPSANSVDEEKKNQPQGRVLEWSGRDR